ncbi:MAG: 30S ribosome-binding factor RbfA [Verrucomicrobiae bacterium]|nr:30S ribosome-binding factor RbfA [Verrucomicrobiae bacterium]
MGSHRMERVNEVMRRELAMIIPKVVPMQKILLTITGVEVKSDLKSADVFLSFLGGTVKEQEAAFDAINQKRGEIQHLVSRRVTMKFTPALHFKVDHSVERGTRLLQILDELEGSAENS